MLADPNAVQIVLRPGMEGEAMAIGFAILLCLTLAILINLKR
jgi:hypothetical protein